MAAASNIWALVSGLFATLNVIGRWNSYAAIVFCPGGNQMMTTPGSFSSSSAASVCELIQIALRISRLAPSGLRTRTAPERLTDYVIVRSSGAMAMGSLNRALFIFDVTGYAVMSSAGNGGRSTMPEGCAANHCFSRPSGKMTGMRS